MRARRATPRPISLLAIALAIIVPCGVLLLPGLGSAAPNPPGNNGTVKIDRVPFDDAPDNQPHVGCTFQVDFYGFDKGDLSAEVRFESHPPTGPVQTLLTDSVFIGEDDNAGGGSEAGLDASETYTLDPDAITPHPIQGFHVKLTVHADGSQGADTKYKVFWVTGCETGATTTTRGGETGSSGSTTTTTISGGGGSTTTTTSGGGDTGGSMGTTTSSGGEVSGGGSSSHTGGGGLPFTGAELLPLLLVGAALLGIGAVALRGGSARNHT